MRDAGIKNQHGVLRAALSQAVRWGWANTNVASMARLRSTKTPRRTVMTLDEVRAVMAAVAAIDPAAALMLHIAAVSGARRAELAALQWSELSDGMLTIDSAIEFVSSRDSIREFGDAATKTANTRTVTLDPDTVAAIEALRRERDPYGPWIFGLGPELVSPTASGGGGSEPARSPASTRSGGCTTSATGRPPWPSARATTSAPSPAASVTPTRR
jgi:integrase